MSNREYLKHVGMEIRVARVRQGKSIADISRQTGLNPNVLSELELGKNDSQILTYKRVVEALGMDMKDFL